MPTTTPFIALGAGNGFTDALSKEDVSFKDHVEPLTLGQAVKFYWLTYRLEHSSKAVRTGTAAHDADISASFTEANWTGDDPEKDYSIPFRRALSTFGNFSYGTLAQENFSTIISSHTVSVRRLYNGDTTNENNFIGYGVPDQFVIVNSTGFDRCRAEYVISSSISGTEVDTSTEKKVFGSTTIKFGDEDFPFVFKANASGRDIDGTLSLSATASGASASISSSIAETKDFEISRYTF